MELAQLPDASLRQRSHVVGDHELAGIYHSAERESVKQPQRERVLEHIVRFAPPRRSKFRFFGLPGREWRFENMLLEECGHAACFGAERSWQVLERSVGYMPRSNGVRPGYQSWDCGDDSLKGFRAGRHRVVHGDVNDLAVLRKRGLREFSSPSPVSWRGLIGRWGAFWLDYQSPLGVLPVARLLAATRLMASPNAPIIPFAITFLMGRDRLPLGRGNPLDVRADAIRKAIDSSYDLGSCFERRTDITDAWTYASASGATMGTVLGVIAGSRSPYWTGSSN